MELDEYDRACFSPGYACVRCGTEMPDPADAPRECPGLE